MMRWLSVALAGGLMLVAVVPAEGATPTPTSTATATATPSVAIPAAPTNVHFGFGLLSITWSDNSDNETGFRVAITIEALAGKQSRTYGVAANSTSLDFAADFTLECGSSIGVDVVAFNSAGESPPGLAGIATDCGPAESTTTPAADLSASSSNQLPPRVLPSTGNAQTPSGDRETEALIAAIMGLGLMAIGVRRRKRLARDRTIR